MRLCPTLYHLELVNKKLPEEDLLLKPVLFKTVHKGKIKFVWHLRKLVYRLKLFDLIGFQLKEWQDTHNLGKKDTLFNSACKDLIPMAEIDRDILELFGKIKDKSPIKTAFSLYEIEVEQYEEKICRDQFESDDEISIRRKSLNDDDIFTLQVQSASGSQEKISGSGTKSEVSTQDTEFEEIVLDAVPPPQPESIISILTSAQYKNINSKTPLTTILPHMLVKRPPIFSYKETLELQTKDFEILQWIPNSLKRHGLVSKVPLQLFCEQQTKNNSKMIHQSKKAITLGEIETTYRRLCCRYPNMIKIEKLPVNNKLVEFLVVNHDRIGHYKNDICPSAIHMLTEHNETIHKNF